MYRIYMYKKYTLILSELFDEVVQIRRDSVTAQLHFDSNRKWSCLLNRKKVIFIIIEKH